MKILVTGGTGFVGSHVSKQLMQAGHDVCLLVRDSDKAAALYQGESATPQLIQGDITHQASVELAVAGCQALVHAAAATPIKTPDTARMNSTNVDGLKIVVNAALAAGVARIVCLSSITAIFDPDPAKVNPDATPVASSMPYGQSKVDGEIFLRELQSQGAPIAILYPGAIIGPDDPGFSASFMALKHRIENGYRIFDDGGMQYIDVRDLAGFIVSLVVDGGTGRFLTPGVYYQWSELADIIEQVSGCTLERIPAKGWKLRAIGSLLDFVRRFKTVDTPISAETMRYATLWPNIANTDEFQQRGIAFRDAQQTFGDAMRWMVQAGHIDAALCPLINNNN